MGKFYVFSCGDFRLNMHKLCLEAGPFESITDAKNLIRDDCAAYVYDSDEPRNCEDDNTFSKYVIFELCEIIQPVARVTVTAKITLKKETDK